MAASSSSSVSDDPEHTPSPLALRVSRFPYLGYAEYDADMDVVKDYVDSVRIEDTDPMYRLLKSTVHTYLITRLESYWRELHDYLFTSAVEDDLVRYTTIFNKYRETPLEAQSLLATIRKIYSDALPQFQALLQKFNTKFNKPASDEYDPCYIDMKLVWRIFHFIGQMFCLNEKSTLDEVHFYRGREFPLANKVGHFGFNTWLYAYFNDILLVGIPVYIQQFDLDTDCVGGFMDHDQEHNRTIDGHDNIQEQWKVIWRLILSTSTLSHYEKQLAIMHMWCMAHEFYGDAPIIVKFTSHPRIFIRAILFRLFAPLIVKLGDEYQRLRGVILSKFDSLDRLQQFFAHNAPYIIVILQELLDANALYSALLPGRFSRSGYPRGEATMIYLQIKQMLFDHDRGSSRPIHQRDSPNVVARAIGWYLMAHWVARDVIVKLASLTVNPQMDLKEKREVAANNFIYYPPAGEKYEDQTELGFNLE